MIYSVLTVGLSEKLVAALQALIIQYDLNFTTSLTTREANRLLERRVFHLLIIGLDYLRTIQQADWLTDIRHISLALTCAFQDSPRLQRLPIMSALNSGDTPNTIIMTIQ